VPPKTPPSGAKTAQTKGAGWFGLDRIGRLLTKGPSAPEAGPTEGQGMLFVHFGVRKTGSSSIQETLYRNDGQRFGYHYPDLKLANGSLAVSQAFVAAERLVKRKLADDVTAAETQRDRVLQMLAHALAAGHVDRPTILSAESIASFDPEALKRLDDFARSHSRNHRYIGYLREPASFEKSAFQETVKRQAPRAAWLNPDAPPEALRSDQHKVVMQLDELVGRQNVLAFAFDRRSFPQGDVVRHFLQQVGVRDDGLKISRANDGLSLLAVKLLYIYRTLLAAHDHDLKSGTTLEPFLADVGGLGGQSFALHPEVSQRILAANQPLLDWSAARLDRPLQAPTLQEDGGVRSEQDLLTVTPDETQLFADHAKGHGFALSTAPDLAEIAATMHKIRLTFAGSAPARRVRDVARVAKASLTAAARGALAGEAPAKDTAEIAAPVLVKAELPLLYLHIGSGKTGTTSIQNFCWANRALLAEAGVIYPDMGVVSGAHHRLSPHIPPFLAQSWSFIEPAEWAPKLAKQAKSAQMPMVLSSELMSSAAEAVVQRSAKILQRHFRVRIIFYARRIDDHVMASYNQNVKAGPQRLPIDDAVQKIFDRLRLDRILTPWIAAFGASQVDVRPYDRSQFPQGDILRDFCRAVGVAWSDRFQTSGENSNARLSREALEYKRILNNVILDTEVSGEFTAPLLDFSANSDAGSTKIFQESDLLPGAVRRVLIAGQAAFYQQIARDCLGRSDGVLFSAPLPEDRLDWVPPVLSNGQIAGITQAIATPALQRILQAQIAEARQSDDPVRLIYASRFLG
jgi:hypothetical protein